MTILYQNPVEKVKLVGCVHPDAMAQHHTDSTTDPRDAASDTPSKVEAAEHVRERLDDAYSALAEISKDHLDELPLEDCIRVQEAVDAAMKARRNVQNTEECHRRVYGDDA